MTPMSAFKGYLGAIVAGLLVVACARVSLVAPDPRPVDALADLAEAGDADAEVALGLLYERGDGVAADPARAAAHYRRAAEAGNTLGQIALGDLYARGLGVARGDAEAAGWYRRAAEQGDASAQLKLGQFYEVGRGVPQDYAEAARWYERAGAGWRRAATAPPGSERVTGVMPGPPVLTPPTPAEPAAAAPATEATQAEPTRDESATPAIIDDDVEVVAAAPPPPVAAPSSEDEPAASMVAPLPEGEPSAKLPGPSLEDEASAPKFTPTPEDEASAQLPATPVPMTATPAPVSAPSASGRGGGIWLHIASFRTAKAALTLADAFMRDNADLIGALRVDLARVDLGSSLGRWVRVRLGPLANRTEAKALCAKLKARDLYCRLLPPNAARVGAE